MRQLPSFADLFFLATAFDSGARTTLDTDRLGIRSTMTDADKARAYEEYLHQFPHVHCEREHDEILVKSKQVNSETALVQWPDGKSYGVILYEGDFYSIVSENTVVEVLASGRGLSVIEAQHNEGLFEPLKRLFEGTEVTA